jgi:dCTP deaminase
MILTDDQINALHIVTPYEPRKVSAGVVSYGQSSMGYDYRISDEWAYISRATVVKEWARALLRGRRPVVDVKRNPERLFTRVVAPWFDLRPGGFVLGHTVEHFNIPDDVLILNIGKSTYARLAVKIYVTPFEPGWRGVPTIEICNDSPLPVRIYAGEGIGQAVFLRSSQPVGSPYGNGKYQDQPASVVSAKVGTP